MCGEDRFDVDVEFGKLICCEGWGLIICSIVGKKECGFDYVYNWVGIVNL